MLQLLGFICIIITSIDFLNELHENKRVDYWQLLVVIFIALVLMGEYK